MKYYIIIILLGSFLLSRIKLFIYLAFSLIERVFKTAIINYIFIFIR